MLNGVTADFENSVDARDFVAERSDNGEVLSFGRSISNELRRMQINR